MQCLFHDDQKIHLVWSVHVVICSFTVISMIFDHNRQFQDFHCAKLDSAWGGPTHRVRGFLSIFGILYPHNTIPCYSTGILQHFTVVHHVSHAFLDVFYKFHQNCLDFRSQPEDCYRKYCLMLMSTPPRFGASLDHPASLGWGVD